MSLPLKRRIAQAALLVAAGATPLVAAGSASADALVPKTDLAAPLSALTSTDGGTTLQNATHELGQAAGSDATGNIVADSLPAATQKAGTLMAPVDKTAATTGTLSAVAAKLSPALDGKLQQAATGRSAGTSADPVGALSQTAGVTPQLPAPGSLTGAVPGAENLTGGLPTGALPTGSMTKALPGADLPGSLGGAPATRGLPGVGGASPVGGLTGGLGPVGGLLGGIGGGNIG